MKYINGMFLIGIRPTEGQKYEYMFYIMFVGSLTSQGLKFRLVFGTFCCRGYCIFILKYSVRQPWFRLDGEFKTLLCDGYDKLVERNVIKPHIRLQRTVETLRTEEFHMAARVIGYANMQTSQRLLDQ